MSEEGEREKEMFGQRDSIIMGINNTKNLQFKINVHRIPFSIDKSKNNAWT